jgi:hypothetical protein
MEELPLQAPLLVNAQVMKDVATWAASEEAKAVNTAIQNHCEAAVKRDIVEGDFKEFETRVMAQYDQTTLEEWRTKLENALGVPHDIMERGREVMAAQMRIAEKACQGYLGQPWQGDADRCIELYKGLEALILARGTKLPYRTRFCVDKANKSRSHAKNVKLGRHAERQAARWHTRSRRYKKWMRVAAKCGVVVWGTISVQPIVPAQIRSASTSFPVER